MKSRTHEIGTSNCRIALKFDRHIGSHAAEVPVKFQSDRTILNTNLAASRLYEILRKDVFLDIETGPRLSCIVHAIAPHLTTQAAEGRDNLGPQGEDWTQSLYTNPLCYESMNEIYCKYTEVVKAQLLQNLHTFDLSN